MSVTEERFRAGTGQRYMGDGVTIRCQAVSKTKLRAFRIAKGVGADDESIQPEDAWPDAQCERAAIEGKLVCGGRGGHGGGSSLVPKYDMFSWMPVDMREMLQTVIENPVILSRKFEMQQLIARYQILYQRLQDDEALGAGSLEELKLGLQEINKGNVDTGRDLIADVIHSREIERETYNEIFQIMALLKEMTKTEVSSMKELKQMVSFDQLVAGLLGVADTLNDALKEFVADERVRELIAGRVSRDITRRFNTRSGPILPASVDTIEGNITSSS